jgi:hypothetical protein
MVASRGIASGSFVLALAAAGTAVLISCRVHLSQPGKVPAGSPRAARPPAEPDPAPNESRQVTPSPKTLDWSRTFSIGEQLWRFEKWLDGGEATGRQHLLVLKNGVPVARLTEEELPGGCIIDVRPLVCPAPYVVLAIRCHSATGHGEGTSFFAIRGGGLRRMGAAPRGECGGPLFQDLDRDGRPEWVFDDHDWYRYYGKGPRYRLVYRLSRSGRLQFWKRLPNPGRRHLPDTAGIDW